MQLKFSIQIWKKGSWFLASCPELDFIAQGKTRAEAQKNLMEVIEIQFEEMSKMGTLEAYLWAIFAPSFRHNIYSVIPAQYLLRHSGESRNPVKFQLIKNSGSRIKPALNSDPMSGMTWELLTVEIKKASVYCWLILFSLNPAPWTLHPTPFYEAWCQASSFVFLRSRVFTS